MQPRPQEKLFEALDFLIEINRPPHLKNNFFSYFIIVSIKQHNKSHSLATRTRWETLIFLGKKSCGRINKKYMPPCEKSPFSFNYQYQILLAGLFADFEVVETMNYVECYWIFLFKNIFLTVVTELFSDTVVRLKYQDSFRHSSRMKVCPTTVSSGVDISDIFGFR